MGPTPVDVIGPRAGTAPLTYEVTELGTVDIQSVFAHFNGAGAAGAWRPTLTIKSQDGTILARLFPNQELAAGDVADVTYAPFLGAAAGGAADDGGLGTAGPPGPVFGNGTDGSITLTQSSAAPAWAAKSGAGITTLFTMNRDLYAINLDLDDSAGQFAVNTNGYRIFANGTMTIDALVTVHRNGNNGGSGATVGAALTRGTVGASGAGGIGGTGGNGSNPSALTASIATTSAVTVTVGGPGGDQVGAPGVGGGTALGGTGINNPINGNPNNFPQATQLMLQGAQTLFAGGNGGGGGDATALNIAGAGGGGGGVVAILAHHLINNGLISAIGGNGGISAGGGAGGGGGGGGQGGAIVLVYVDDGVSVPGSTSVAGGLGAAGVGTGKDGGPGTVGLVWTQALG